MAKAGSPDVSPKTFFLNERQELSSFDRDGGGRASTLVSIDWSERSANLSQSFAQAVASPPGSRDPTTTAHHFIVAVPVATVARVSKSQKAQGGQIAQAPTFGGEQSKIFRRLGMDLIEALPEGRASVHIAASRVEQLMATMRALPAAGGREQSRWINLREFQPSDRSMRIDFEWLESLAPERPVETFLRLQPTLTRAEVQDVLQVLAGLLDRQDTRLLKAGREFSGRYWCTGWFTREQLIPIVEEFGSIQSIHPRFATPLAGQAKRRSVSATLPPFSALPSLPIAQLPTVAIVDAGIPEEHVLLAAYRRNGYRNPDLDPTVRHLGDHGSTVASCAVFGAVDLNQGLPGTPTGACQVMDVMIGLDATAIDFNALEN